MGTGVVKPRIGNRKKKAANGLTRRAIGNTKKITRNGRQMAGTKSMVIQIGKTVVVAPVAVGKMEEKMTLGAKRKKVISPSYQVIGIARAVTIIITPRMTNAESAAQ